MTRAQAQQVAWAFAKPEIAKTFYGGKDFSSQAPRVDEAGNMIIEPYKPIPVTKEEKEEENKEGASLARGGQITDNSTDHLLSLLHHILGSGNDDTLTEEDLLNIVKKGI
jgi:hypothetical protein